MKEFIEYPAKKSAIRNRKPVFGCGINDVAYRVEYTDSCGKRLECPFYRKWRHMLARCYSPAYQERFPTYKGCSVCDEWLIFSSFKEWMMGQDWADKYLDKDILCHGNKEYSPRCCVFVSNEVNNIMHSNSDRRGGLPQGVSLVSGVNRYRTQCKVKGKVISLGRYDTPEKASEVYRIFKSKNIARVAQDYKSNKRLYDALIKLSESALTL